MKFFCAICFILIRFYIQRFIIFKRSLDDPLPNVRLAEGFKMRRITEENINYVSPIVGPIKQRQFLKRLRRGVICIAVFDGEKIIYYTWIDFKRANLEGTTLWQLSENEVFFFNSYTLPSYRNIGIHTAMCVERIKIAKDRGYDLAIISVSAKNRFAQKALRRVGFRRYRIITFLKILGVRKWWHSRSNN